MTDIQISGIFSSDGSYLEDGSMSFIMDARENYSAIGEPLGGIDLRMSFVTFLKVLVSPVILVRMERTIALILR